MPESAHVRFVPEGVCLDLPSVLTDHSFHEMHPLCRGAWKLTVVTRVLLSLARGPRPLRGISDHCQERDSAPLGPADNPIRYAPIETVGSGLSSRPLQVEPKPANTDVGQRVEHFISRNVAIDCERRTVERRNWHPASLYWILPS